MSSVGGQDRLAWKRERGFGTNCAVPLRRFKSDNIGRASAGLSMPLSIVPTPYGSVAHCGSRWLKSQIRIEGDHKIYTRKGDSGFSPRWHFCPNCGSNVFTESDRAPDLCIITVGSFADPNFPAPTASIYEESMHSWFGLSTVSHHFAQGSPRDARGLPINH